MSQRLIYRLADRDLPASVGSKALNLRRLRDKGFRVPDTLICTWDAYQQYLQDDLQVMEQLKQELHKLIDPAERYAVRSSADVEDNLERSFAGQFKTVLNTSGVENIMQAIWSIWATAHSDAVQTYLKRMPNGAQSLRMAVIVQKMVNPIISGVAFSKNPLTAADEIIVEAIKGSGAALVQEGSTPQRWVNKWGKWITQPEADGIPLETIQHVVHITQKIARVFRADVDLEWVYDGQQLTWLQMRSITSTHGLKIYSNRISKEMLPGLIKPLVWSVNIPLTNGQWVRLISEATGDQSIEPTSLAKAFYYRCYFDMGTFGRIFDSLGLPPESLEMMMGIVPPGAGKPPVKPRLKFFLLLPRLILFMLGKLRFVNQIDKKISRLEALYATFNPDSIARLDKQECLASLDRLMEVHRELTYSNIIIQLALALQNSSLERGLKRQGLDSQSLDIAEGLDELKQYNPNHSLASLSRQFQQMEPQLQERIAQSNYEQFLHVPGFEDFQSAVAAFMDKFGHLSDSGVDFSYTPWREKPDLVLKMILSYPENKSKLRENLAVESQTLISQLPRRLQRTIEKTRRMRVRRERIGSVYTYGLDILRRHYARLADHLLAEGLIADKEDIFYLLDDEIHKFVRGDMSGEGFGKLVADRKQDMEQCQDMSLPGVIYGDTPPPALQLSSKQLNGTPSSRGYYTGKTRVVHGMEEFDKVKPGDILVIPYSDVGWTPLFAKAGAVIAESGGLLSHSSIIAREYRIPAVVSVVGALQIGDDQLVSIDGYKGVIVIHDA